MPRVRSITFFVLMFFGTPITKKDQMSMLARTRMRASALMAWNYRFIACISCWIALVLLARELTEPLSLAKMSFGSRGDPLSTYLL